MNFNKLTSGKTIEDSEIKAFRSEIISKKYIYLLAGVHGDEVEGVYVLKKLFEWIKEDNNLELPFIVVPILNMDGHRSGTRVNSNGVDLNRNLNSSSWTADYTEKKYFPGKRPMSEPENKFLKGLFDKFPPKIIFSFHTWKPLINYDGQIKDIAEFLSKRNGYKVFDHLEDHPTPGSLGSYATEKYKCPVLTFECPELSDDLTLEDIWNHNKLALTELFESNLIK